MSPRAQERRRQILETALDQFAQNGYHETGVADIAAELRMSHGTFYRYFESKRAILDDVVDALAERIRSALRSEASLEGLITPSAYEAHLRQSAGALLGIVADDPRIARLLLFEATGVDDDLRLRVLTLIDQLRGQTAAHLRVGVQNGFLRADLDVEETARAINGLIYAGALAALRQTEFPVGYVDAALSLLLGGVMAPGLLGQDARSASSLTRSASSLA
jgi:AcrR family transcriptional regulator